MAPNVTYVLTLSVKEKKKPLPCVIYILSFLCFSVPLLGKTAPIVQTLGSKGHNSYENQP